MTPTPPLPGTPKMTLPSGTSDVFSEAWRWIASTEPWYENESHRPPPDTGSDYWAPPPDAR